MSKKHYVHPQIVFEEIEEQIEVLAGSPHPETDPLGGIDKDVNKGDGDEDYAKRSDFIFDESEDWSSQNTF